MNRPLRLFALLFAAPSGIALPAGAQQWKDSIRTQLESWIVPSHTSSDRLRITQQGTALVVNKEGISASPGADAAYLKNTLRNGQVEQAKGFAAMLANKKTNRDYRVGEKVYMYKTDINDDDIAVFLISQETAPIVNDGKTEQTRYKALLHIEFPKRALPTMPFAQVKEVIATVLKPADEAATPATVEIGQTPGQVEAEIGKPEKILKVGTKTIYVYKDIKVTFVDGKVTDIQ